ncbi:hypothetical protein ACI4AF_29325, partial [Klebsiella pneumoniae]|uniref:hypothetical protein n=1 Tax=Klebsiella pneumoniae TaxID=573 RepID=UPI003852BD79
RVLKRFATGAFAQALGGAAADNRPVRNHDNVITQRADFLHHVTGQENATSVIPKANEQPTQTPNRHHVQSVGRLVQQDIARPVNE